MQNGLSIIDLFAGAGGLSVGATLAGCDVRLSVEIDPLACETLRANDRYHGQVLQGDVCEIDGRQLRKLAGLRGDDPVIIVGGAPCQPFSKAAYWVEEGEEAKYRRERAEGKKVVRPPAPSEPRADVRRDLVGEFWRLVEGTSADGFVFENVPSIRHPRNRPIFEHLKASAIGAGYYITEVVANAAEFGVAQKRERVFLLGSRTRAPIAPTATHSLDGSDLLLKPATTAAEALDGLDDENYFEPEEVVSGRWAAHLREVPPGWNYKAHTAWAGHPSPTFVTETRFWNFLLKLDPGRPSWTLAASPGPWTGPFHWASRRLRTPEMAALQGFPRGYKIFGSRRDRVKQIGNAVPPPLAKVMIEATAKTVGH